MSRIGEHEAGTVSSTCHCLLRAGCYGALPLLRAINYDAVRLLFNSGDSNKDSGTLNTYKAIWSHICVKVP